MAQHVIPAAQLVPQYKPIGRCNNYAVLQSIPCSPECKIVGLILLDHCLSHALTATVDVPAVYLQQFWRTVSKLIIADLMNKFPNIPKRIEEDYHSIKDDVPLVSVYTTGNVSVRGMLILDAFLAAEVRETDDFKEYETVFMKVSVPMNQPQPVVSTQGTNRNTPRAHRSPTVSADPPETKKRKQIAGESSSPRKSLKITIKQRQIVEKDDDDSEDRIEPGSHKDNPEFVDDDDDKAEEKHSDNMGSLEIRNEETQTTIPTPLSSPRKILSSDKKTYQELADIVSIPTTTTSKHSQVKKRISSKYSHLPGALRRMCRRQGYMIQDMERKCVTTTKFWETHNKIDDILHEIVPQIAKNEFNAHAPTIIEELFKNYVQSNVVHVHPTTTTSTDTESSATLQYQLYLKMKRSLQDRADDIALWEALRRKFEKSSPSNTSCREDDFDSQHDKHQDDDAPPEGEKRVKISKGSKRSKSARGSLSKYSSKDSTKYVSKQQIQQQEWDAWEDENFIDEDEVIPEDETPKLIAEVYKQNQKKVRKNPEDYYSNHRITEVVRIVTDQPHGLDIMEQILVMRANDKSDSFSEADFKYLNKNDIEDLYYLCRSKEIDNRKIKLMNSLITFIRSCVIWERFHDFQLGIESYQMKVNLIAPTLTFPGIEEHAPYSIVDEPQMGLIYLNRKDEKRVMYLEEIVKFCDATLEKVLKGVKIGMFESQFLKKPPLLGDLDQDIIKAYEREISKRLSH
ncbi:hypothetical protein Tco_1385527 [Tanacetum coccineum]